MVLLVLSIIQYAEIYSLYLQNVYNVSTRVNEFRSCNFVLGASDSHRSGKILFQTLYNHPPKHDIRYLSLFILLPFRCLHHLLSQFTSFRRYFCPPPPPLPRRLPVFKLYIEMLRAVLLTEKWGQRRRCLYFIYFKVVDKLDWVKVLLHV